MSNLTETMWNDLEIAFGDILQRDVPLGPFTSSRVGGPADGFIIVKSRDELSYTASTLWSLNIPFIVIGSGSNILVSDSGIRKMVVLNRAKEIKIFEEKFSVWAESGASLGLMARKVSSMGLGGLEWASGIPGTVGGAIYGNAGAHGGDVAGSLSVAEILHHARGIEQLTTEKMGYEYRSSLLKRESIDAVILSAEFNLKPSSKEASRHLVEKYATWRKERQPPGASMGSMFKNPAEDSAGKLIDLCGLKGARIGDVQISTTHANFFINNGRASANDILHLIKLTQKEVKEKFGVELDLEIQLIGDWEGNE